MKKNKREKIYYVYQHIRDDTNEVFYIGIGTKNQNKKYRCKIYYRGYLKAPSRRSQFWLNVYKKCKTITVNILFESNDLEFIKQKEIDLIAKYGRKCEKEGSLVNLTKGGDGSFGIKWSEEAKKRRSELYLGDHNPFKGKNHSEETKKLFSKQRKGKKMGKENSFYGHTHSDKTKSKIS